MDFAYRIKELRETLGLSQREFAEKLGKARRTIQHWESGNITPPENVLRLIEQTFSVNPEWLRHGKGEMFLSKQQEIDPEDLTEEDVIRLMAQKLVDKVERKLRKRGKKLSSKQKEELLETFIEELKEFGEIKTLRFENILSA